MGFTWTVGAPGGPAGDGGGRSGRRWWWRRGRRRRTGRRWRAGGMFGGGAAAPTRPSFAAESASSGARWLSLFSQAASATGLANSETQLVCTGDAVPQPDWENFQFNPSSRRPDRGRRKLVCPDGPTVGDDLRPKLRRRARGGHRWALQRRILERYNLNVDASYTRGVAQTGVHGPQP